MYGAAGAHLGVVQVYIYMRDNPNNIMVWYRDYLHSCIYVLLTKQGWNYRPAVILTPHTTPYNIII